MMQSTARHTEPVTGLIPVPRRPGDAAEPAVRSLPASAAQPGLLETARRAFEVARAMRSLRPVSARPQGPYGEVDGQ